MDKYLIHELAVDGSATHVIVIGIGAYPHLLGGSGSETEYPDGMGQLTSPPVSAREIAKWFIKYFNHPEKPLSSVSLLLSEREPSSFTNPITHDEFSIETATFSAVDEAISSGEPISWDWTFQGATPLSSSVPNPSGIIYTDEGIYTVRLEVSNGSDSDQEVKAQYISIVVGIEEHLNIEQLLVYPNPTDGIFNLKISSRSNQQLTYSIFNPQGKLIMSKESNLVTGDNTFQIDLEKHAAGIYLITLKIEDQQYTIKVNKFN